MQAWRALRQLRTKHQAKEDNLRHGLRFNSDPITGVTIVPAPAPPLADYADGYADDFVDGTPWSEVDFKSPSSSYYIGLDWK